ncbi:helix-turn-helix domain-containing protein [Marinoscillum sp. 108]|uniref:helix-turn-helix domain-containing protein n=1 Tax=Marinoscillum sp. 108 TaxID=2653151 RepID=UPI0012F130EE|nr:helix-turn-helix domain-containing protein [Marinoscillum sp. 108]VXD10713.1 Transcriptional regulator, AraC family [Marinoscillum sp. 108]
MEYLIVAGIVLSVLLLTVTLSKKNKQTPDKHLILYLGFATFWQAYFYLETLSFLQASPFMLLGKGLYLLNAPLFFAYVYVLTTSRRLTPKLSAILFSPFAAYVIHFMYFHFLVFDQADLSIKSGLLFIDGQLALSWLFFVILFLLIEPVFLVWFYFLLKKYKQRLLQSESDLSRIRLRWLYLLFYLCLIISLFLIPASMLSLGGGLVSTDLLPIMMQGATVLFLFIVGYYGFRQTTVFANPALDLTTEDQMKNGSYQRSGLSDGQAAIYHAQLLTLMEEKKPYLNGELKASELAQMLDISVNHLSQVLNNIQQQNFFDFVNGYRIKEVIKKMEAPKNSHLTLLAMALDSGFNSKTSFNTVFKKMTHQTPSAFYKSLTSSLQEKG